MTKQQYDFFSKFFSNMCRGAALAGLGAILLNQGVTSASLIISVAFIFYFLQNFVLPQFYVAPAEERSFRAVHPLNRDHFDALPEELQSEFAHIFHQSRMQSASVEQQAEISVSRNKQAPKVAASNDQHADLEQAFSEKMRIRA